MDLTTALVVAAGAPEDVTYSVEILAEPVAEVVARREQHIDFSDEAFVASFENLENEDVQPQ